jgi:hypothetical protein
VSRFWHFGGSRSVMKNKSIDGTYGPMKINRNFRHIYRLVVVYVHWLVMSLMFCRLLLSLWLVRWFMVFYNISAISWWPVLLAEETVVPGEIHRPVASHWQTLSHNVEHISSTPRHERVQTDNFSSLFLSVGPSG